MEAQQPTQAPEFEFPQLDEINGLSTEQLASIRAGIIKLLEAALDRYETLTAARIQRLIQQTQMGFDQVTARLARLEGDALDRVISGAIQAKVESAVAQARTSMESEKSEKAPAPLRSVPQG